MRRAPPADRHRLRPDGRAGPGYRPRPPGTGGRRVARRPHRPRGHPQVADLVEQALGGRSLPGAELAAGVSGLTPGRPGPTNYSSPAPPPVSRGSPWPTTSVVVPRRKPPRTRRGRRCGHRCRHPWRRIGDRQSRRLGHVRRRRQRLLDRPRRVEAALRAFDGRGAPTALTELAQTEFGPLDGST